MANYTRYFCSRANCGKDFHAKANLRLHEQNTHRTTKEKCEHCGKFVKLLNQHVLRQHKLRKNHRVPATRKRPLVPKIKRAKDPYPHPAVVSRSPSPLSLPLVHLPQQPEPKLEHADNKLSAQLPKIKDTKIDLFTACIDGSEENGNIYSASGTESDDDSLDWGWDNGMSTSWNGDEDDDDLVGYHINTIVVDLTHKFHNLLSR